MYTYRNIVYIYTYTVYLLIKDIKQNIILRVVWVCVATALLGMWDHDCLALFRRLQYRGNVCLPVL